MKRIWVYLLGVLTGIIVTVIVFAVIGVAINAQNDPATKMASGITFFEEPGDIIEPTSVKVFQALADGAALAHCKGSEENDWYGDPTVLLYNEDGIPYYDDQIVNSSDGKCFRQVGIYRYESRMGDKTVPVVMILDN